MSGLTSSELRTIDWLESHRAAMLELLEELVNTDSGSNDKAGVDRAGEALKRFLLNAGIAVSIIKDDEHGNAIIATVENEAKPNEKSILLMGHRDTVFPKGEASKRPFRVEKDRAFGPGVNDMKSGVVINAFVLAALSKQHELRVRLCGLFTGDEEIASPFSRAVIEQQARNSLAVFNAEPARPNGNIVTGRKGGVFLLLEVSGKSAHSGVNFFEGISAIEELAEKIVRLRAITQRATGVTLNIGLVRGGQSVNTVADYAAAELDLRYVDRDDRETALHMIRAIANESFVANASCSLSVRGEFLPLIQTPGSSRLLQLYRSAAEQLGISLSGEFTGGCADSGFASATGVPTLCGVGAVGGKSHTPDEYIEIDTLTQRAKILAIAVARCASGKD